MIRLAESDDKKIGNICFKDELGRIKKVNKIRETGTNNAYEFYCLPGRDHGTMQINLRVQETLIFNMFFHSM